MRVGFAGAGRIGRPMVRRLLAAGHAVRVFARTDAARRALAGDGAEVVPALTGIAGGADAVVVCVHTDEQVRQVCLDGGVVAALPAGAVLVVHTTGSPRTAEELARAAAERDALVVDAPVSGGPHDVEAGRVTLFAGGAGAAMARAMPVLTAYGDPVLHVGPEGAGQRVKLINNAVFAANIGLLAHAVELAAHLGLEETAVIQALQHGSGASRALAGIGAHGTVAGFARAVGEFVGKDVAIVRDVACELGGDLGPLGAAHQVLAGLLTEPGQARALASAPGPAR
ncbi:3-hydroxyisobutyrate dehydrogenase-like beta-hydroxyacid dehydrogenase [Thermocatellispora tengchongensis]|uniref:3-hydroxyisobutyrate dehydrogenase-like beta-hydroxyacid dehydrogenase n=1 Tax=Thermocatellispora tengchongensis TaxID=1073253 RepID=A0A840PF24_9ACTN|nr:NAD(P)-binding domain-containing protein [Thermocatellispora tengchongensis]MBB5137366.1 3-hydroxyisobutyrate dehydrogenase-like beta-hydroxyacid dehydrogenase [Thermocatellispora tengchongensis]